MRESKNGPLAPKVQYHKKKKKKKKSGEKQRRGWCGSGNYTWAMNVEAMRVQWYRSGGEVVLVECAKWRQVYTIGISLVACGE